MTIGPTGKLTLLLRAGTFCELIEDVEISLVSNLPNHSTLHVSWRHRIRIQLCIADLFQQIVCDLSADRLAKAVEHDL